MNIRNKLIKWLGGYTKYEYECHVYAPLKIHVEEQKVETLKFRKLIDNRRFPQEDMGKFIEYAKKDTLYNMLDKIHEEGYVQYYTHGDSQTAFTEIECRLCVVKPEVSTNEI